MQLAALLLTIFLPTAEPASPCQAMDARLLSRPVMTPVARKAEHQIVTLEMDEINLALHAVHGGTLESSSARYQTHGWLSAIIPPRTAAVITIEPVIWTTLGSARICIDIIDEQDPKDLVRLAGERLLAQSLPHNMTWDSSFWQPRARSAESAADLFRETGDAVRSAWASYIHALLSYLYLAQWDFSASLAGKVANDFDSLGLPYLSLRARELRAAALIEPTRADTPTSLTEKRAAAMAELREIAESQVKIAHAADAAWTYNDLGILHFYQGNHDAARSAYLEALALADQTEARTFAALAAGNLAISARRSGQLGQSIATLRDVTRQYGRSLDDTARANLLYELGNLYLRAGHLGDAIVSFHGAYLGHRKGRSQSDLTRSLNGLALGFLSLGKPDQALDFLTLAPLTDPRIETGASRQNARLQAEALIQQQRYQGALKLLEKMLPGDLRTAAVGEDEAAHIIDVLLKYALCLRRIGDEAAATNAIHESYGLTDGHPGLRKLVLLRELEMTVDPRRVDRLLESIGDFEDSLLPNEQVLYFHRLARLAHDRGDLQSSIEINTTATDLVRSLAHLNHSPEIGLSLLGTREAVFRDQIEFRALAAAHYRAAGDVVEEERSTLEAISLLEELRVWEMHDQVAYWRAADSLNSHSGNRNPAWIALDRSIELISTAQSSAQYRNAGGFGRPDVTTLSFFQGRERFWAFIVEDRNIIAVELADAATVETFVEATRTAVQAPRRTSKPFGDDVFATLIPHIRSDRVRIVADGQAHHYPFAISFPDHVIEHAPAIMSLPAQALSGFERAAIVYNPSYERPTAAKSDASAISLASLPGTVQEANALSERLGPANTLLVHGDHATPTAVTEMMKEPWPLMHIGAHGLLGSTPAKSGLLLSPVVSDHRTTNGSLLNVPTIASHDTRTGLVVLASCDSAVGTSLGFSGSRSLTDAFIAAGTKGVISSLWPVDDQATAVFMEAFYQALLDRGLDPAAALATAQKALKESPYTRLRHERVWAGWRLTTRPNSLESYRNVK